MPVPSSIDRRVLRTYLADHLTGATAWGGPRPGDGIHEG